MNESKDPKILIAVLTYRREESLQVCVKSIQNSAEADGIDAQIVIVDNDPDSNVAPFSQNGVDRVYFGHGRVGIARNRVVELARSQSIDFLILLDDDEIVSPEWLSSLVGTAKLYQCGAVVGPVIPTGLPDRLVPLYVRRRRQTGTVVPAAGAGNILLKLRQLGDINFDENWSIPAGEDTDFTTRITRSGTKIVWCDEAVVHEPVSVSRLKHRWLAIRYFNNGRALARIESERRSSRSYAWLLSRGLVGILLTPTFIIGVAHVRWMRIVLDHGIRNVGWVYGYLEQSRRV